eukprot:5749292-Prymnesium_polylepis.1
MDPLLLTVTEKLLPWGCTPLKPVCVSDDGTSVRPSAAASRRASSVEPLNGRRRLQGRASDI